MGRLIKRKVKMKYKNVGKAVILEAGETRTYEMVMNDIEMVLLPQVDLIHGKGRYGDDFLKSNKRVRIIIQIEE